MARRVHVGVGRYIVAVVEVPGARYRVEIVDDAGEEGVGVRFVRLGLVWREGRSVVGDGEGESEGGRIGGERLGCAGGRRRDGRERGGCGDCGEVCGSSDGGDEAVMRFIKRATRGRMGLGDAVGKKDGVDVLSIRD